MKITQLLIYLFIWCQAAETLDQLTDLGQNVTINCDLDEGDIYWLLLKVPDPPVMILRTLSTTSLFFNTTFRQKYSVQSKNLLFINNITVNELGVYYCMKTDTPPKFSSGIRLQIKKESCDSQIEVNYVHQNHTVLKFIEQDQTHWMIIIVISAVLHGVLITVVIASGCYHCAKNQTPENARLQQTQHLKQLDDTIYTLYTAVSFSSFEQFGQVT